MRYGDGHREEARRRMVAAAGRGFRRKGYAGIGVDGLAKEAQVTSGAFYGHFASKDAAFREAVAAGLDELHGAIEALQDEHGADWLGHFVAFYLGEKRTCDLAQSCAMQSLSPDVARADPETRAVYRAGMMRVVERIAAGLPSGTAVERNARAWRLVSLLSGAVTLARAVGDADIGARIADVVAATAADPG